MQRLEVSGAVRLIYRSLGVEGLKEHEGSLPRSQHSLYQPKKHSTKYNKIQTTTYIRFTISVNYCVFRHRAVRFLVDALNVPKRTA